MRRGAGWAAALAALGILGVGAALLLLPPPPSPPGPEAGRTLYRAHCAACHGADGQGRAWRAHLLFLRPGNLASPETAALPDQYLVDITRHGGSSFGKPGMPSFGFVLSEDDIRAVIAYLRALPPPPPPAGGR